MVCGLFWVVKPGLLQVHPLFMSLQIDLLLSGDRHGVLEVGDGLSKAVETVVMADSPLFFAHPAHLVEEHVQEALFRGKVRVRLEVRDDDLSVDDQSMLVHDGFQGINDAVFLSDVGPDLFDVNSLFGLG